MNAQLSRSRLAGRWRWAALAVLAALLIVALLRVREAPDATAPSGPARAAPSAPTPHRAATVEDPVDAPTGTPSAGGEPEVDCLTPGQLRNDPAFRQDLERVLAVVVRGPFLRQYEGIEEAGLASLAEQGDTAAMLLLGRRLQLGAAGLDAGFAITSLTAMTRETFQKLQPLADRARLDTPEREALALAARDWYYRAALNGRLFALELVGEIDDMLGRDAVAQGWIDTAAFEALPEDVRNRMSARRVYLAAIPFIAPELDSGILEGLVRTTAPQAAQVIAAAVAERFDTDRAAAGLPPLELRAVPAADLEAYGARVCAQYRDGWLDILR